MRFLAAFKLGHKLSISHKKTFLVIATFFGILFSTVVLLSSLLSYFQNQIIAGYSNATGGKILAQISICNGSYQTDDENEKCKSPEEYDNIIRKEVEKYHGELIGAVISYTSSSSDEMISVIPEKASKILGAEPAYYSPDNKIPVVISSDYNDRLEEQNFYNLGIFPGNKNGLYMGDNPYKNNFLNSFINNNTSEDMLYLVLDNTERVQDYLIQNQYLVYYYSPLAVFDSYEDAHDFYRANSSFNIKELFTNRIKTDYEYQEKQVAVKYLFVCYLIILITTLTLVLIIDYKKDEKLITLYRSLGASRANISMIYIISVLEMIICITIIALLVGLIANKLIISWNQDTINTAMIRFFGI